MKCKAFLEVISSKYDNKLRLYKTTVAKFIRINIIQSVTKMPLQFPTTCSLDKRSSFSYGYFSLKVNTNKGQIVKFEMFSISLNHFWKKCNIKTKVCFLIFLGPRNSNIGIKILVVTCIWRHSTFLADKSVLLTFINTKFRSKWLLQFCRATY